MGMIFGGQDVPKEEVKPEEDITRIRRRIAGKGGEQSTRVSGPAGVQNGAQRFVPGQGVTGRTGLGGR
jgi:hypothetical protein